MDTQDASQQQAHINDDKGPATLGANIACLVIAYLGIILRLIARRLARARIGTDDWLIIAALFLYTATAIDGVLCVTYGAGKHELAVEDKQAGFAKTSFAFIILYRPSIALVKFSVLFLYRRIFPQAGFRSVLTYYGIFLFIYTTVFLVLDIFHCRPVSGAWTMPDEKKSCLSLDTIWIVGGSLNAVTDIAALCLPMPLLWKLHVAKDKRIQLMGIFLLGGFVCIVAIIRVVELGGLQSSADATFGYSTTIIWSTVEVGVGIFCACLPVMRPILNLFTDYVPTMEAKSGGQPLSSVQKSSRLSNFRMKSFRASQRLNDGEEQEPFAGGDSKMATSAVRLDIRDQLSDAEAGLSDTGINVTTKIEQQFNIGEMKPG